jgi:hypothetical protein
MPPGVSDTNWTLTTKVPLHDSAGVVVGWIRTRGQKKAVDAVSSAPPTVAPTAATIMPSRESNREIRRRIDDVFDESTTSGFTIILNIEST